MPLRRLAKSKLLFSERLPVLAGGPLTFVDVGARGDLDEPWSLMAAGALSVIGFEPDAAECENLNAKVGPGVKRRYFPTALWSEDKSVPFCINAVPATSSVYPANMKLIQRFEEEHWRPREVARMVDVRALTLDTVVAQQGIDPDFLKLDTQGAELPILKGAKKTLQENIVAVLTETWCAEVYAGQGLSGDVLSFMHSYGFSLFDINIAAGWQRAGNGANKISDRQQIIGLDFLFLRDNVASSGSQAGLSKVIKAAAIADCFGFAGAALQFLDDAKPLYPVSPALVEAFDRILSVARRQQTLRQRIGRRLDRLMGNAKRSSPSLHY
jgi:FkbM family methyltransferase